MRPRNRRTKLATLGAVAAIAVASTATLAGAASSPRAGQRVDLKVLLLATDAADSNIQAWADNLKREGVPYDLITGATTLTASTFADGERAKYQGVIASGPNGTAGGVVDGFTVEEFGLLYAFEKKFGIRQLDLNAYPGPPLGLGFPTSSGTMDGTTATLTTAGLAQFPALKGPVPFENLDSAVSESFGTSATPCDGVAVPACNATSFEPILQGAGGASLVGIAQTKDGREEMVSTFNGNQFQLHNSLLRHGMLTWVTRGVYLGLDRSYLSIDVDDVFVPDDKWNPTLNTTIEDSDAAGYQAVRMTAGDVTRTVQWQNTNSVKLNMLFNGKGVEDYRAANPVRTCGGLLGLSCSTGPGPDPLFNAFMANKAQFPWINHTFSHPSLGSPNPDVPSEAIIRGEISQNVAFATANALPGFDKAELTTGEHSGIGTSKAAQSPTGTIPVSAPNPNMAAALNAEGVTTVGADNSREAGQRRIGANGAYTLPRYPMNVFYNVATWADQLDEYDWLYLAKGTPGGDGNCTNTAVTTCFTSKVTQAQFVDREATAVVRRMLGNDPRPHYAHQSNLISDAANPKVENRGDGILYVVMGEALKRYRSYYNTPFLQPKMTALREELRRQEAWTAAVAAKQVGGYIEDGKVTITSTVAIDAPITGTEFGDVYGGQRSGWRPIAANGTVALAPGDPSNTVAPAISGAANPGSTLTTSDGTWTGSPPITFARQWQRRANAGSPWADIEGATGQTYAVVATDAGQDLRSVITGTNRISAWSMATSAPVTVSGGPPPAATAPANTVLPAVTGTAAAGSTLTTSDGTWTGTAPIAYARRWQRRANATAAWTDIGGATGQTYAVTAADAGQQLRSVVVATNSVSSTSAFSAAVTVAAAATAPVNTALPRITGTVRTTRTLTASTGTWTGTAPITFTYQWQRSNDNGATWTSIATARSSTFTVRTADRGFRLRVQVTGRNSVGTATASSAATTAVTNGGLLGLF